MTQSVLSRESQSQSIEPRAKDGRGASVHAAAIKYAHTIADTANNKRRWLDDSRAYYVAIASVADDIELSLDRPRSISGFCIFCKSRRISFLSFFRFNRVRKIARQKIDAERILLVSDFVSLSLSVSLVLSFSLRFKLEILPFRGCRLNESASTNGIIGRD